jgi:spermidine synthase
MAATLPRPAVVAIITFTVGAAALGTEIAAARLLAPWFGASTIVWANTIATVLLALSAGYWLGGRLAERRPGLYGLCLVTLAAAVLLAVVPFVARPFLRASADALDDVSAGVFVGSLLGVCVLVAAPVLALGMVSPYAVRLSVAGAEGAGRVSGQLYAISTLGSLVGTFAAALGLIPLLGTRRTFLVFALALALAACLGLPLRALVAPAAIAALMLVPTGTIKAEDGARVIWEAETDYQYARVVERADGRRRLELNEGQVAHSTYQPGRWLTGGYWDEALVLPLASAGRPPHSIAILGGAAGTNARAYGHFFPGTRIDLVEIDGELLDAGHRLFDLHAPLLHEYVADARPFLRRGERRWDALYIDAYRQPYIPFYMATAEFFALARDRLAPGGSLVINVGHPERSTALEQALTATLRSQFRTVLRDPAQEENTQLLATDAPGAGPARMREAVDSAAVPAELAPLGQAAAARLGPGLGGGEVYTDDRAPIEWLVDVSLAEVASEGSR